MTNADHDNVDDDDDDDDYVILIQSIRPLCKDD